MKPTGYVLTKLNSRLEDIADQMADELDPVIRQGAEMVASAARNNAPAGPTGKLRSSIRVVEHDKGQYNVVADAKAEGSRGRTAGAYYGIFVEFGTRHQAPNPFMLRSLEQTEPQVLEMVREKLGEL